MDSLVKVNSTKKILTDLNRCIVKKKPFSIVRFGDAVHGIVCVFTCPDIIDNGKWSGDKGKKLSNSILGQLTIPTKRRKQVVNRVIVSANRANYCDSYDAYKLLGSNYLGILGRKWKEIHEGAGITNTNYCSCFVHYFSIVDGEYNLFDIMKGRRIFCITSKIGILDKVKEVSGAKEIVGCHIPGRGRGRKHFRNHFSKTIGLIRTNAKNFDLFLIGAGLLGKIYCDEVKKNGGRAFDCGRLFDFWSEKRKIDSRPKRFLVYNNSKLLCDRIKTGAKGVW